MNTKVTSSVLVAASVGGIFSGGVFANSASDGGFSLTPDGKFRAFKSSFPSGGRECGASTTLTISKDTISKWNSSLEGEFEELVAKSALGEPMTKEEQMRFKLLRDKRRMLKNPPSIEERLFEIRRAKRIEEELQELRKYVQFFKSQNTK
jgi:hypothetical protein